MFVFAGLAQIAGWRNQTAVHMLWFGTVVAAWFYSTLPWHVCSFSGGSYQQHLGMLEQWIDSNGHAAQHVGKQNGRRKGAKTAGTSLLAFNIPFHCCMGRLSL